MPILIWLPGGKRNAQHGRLRTILSPLCDAVRHRGFAVELRSFLDDDFADDPDGVNIWLATDLAEFPPRRGVNILWFLTQMKIVTQPVLMAHDAVLTASQDHLTFLQNWIGAERHIGLAGWPVAPLEILERRGAREGALELEPLHYDDTKPQARIKDMPADAAALQASLSPYEKIVSNVPLRERMCGFYRYEEVIALMAGCSIESETRQGLIPPLAAMFATAGDDKALALSEAKHADALAVALAVDTIADVIVRAVEAAARCRDGRDARTAVSGHGYSQECASEIQDEWGSLCRDAAYLLDHPILQTVLTEDPKSTRVDLGNPWEASSSLNTSDTPAPLPWTDLSLARSLCDAAAEQRTALTAQDRATLSALALNLSHCNAALLTPQVDPALPNVPWKGVALASAERGRVFTDLSRALNGHCLYRFSQCIGKPRTLSPFVPVIVENTPLPLDKTAIFLHAFYVDLAKIMLDSLPETLHGCVLHLTTDIAEKASELEAHLSAGPWSQFKVHLVPNRGRDIYPKLVHLAGTHLGYDYVLHLHTKRSPHSRSLKSWGRDANNRLAGTPETIQRVFSSFAKDERLGIIYPDPPENLHPAMSWVRNLRLAEMLAAHLRLDILPKGSQLDFPVGSMFWVRTAAIAPILDANLTMALFPFEDAQEDGTLAHTMERVLGVVCQSKGWRLART